MGPSAYMLRGGAAVGGTIDAERAGESIKALRESLDALRKGDHFDEDFVRARRKLLQPLLGESTVTTELAGRLGADRDVRPRPELLQHAAPADRGGVAGAGQGADHARARSAERGRSSMLADKDHLDKTFTEAGLKDVKIVEPDYK